MVKTEKQAVFSRTFQTKNQYEPFLKSSLQPTYLPPNQLRSHQQRRIDKITVIPNDWNRDFSIKMARKEKETPPKRELRWKQAFEFINQLWRKIPNSAKKLLRVWGVCFCGCLWWIICGSFSTFLTIGEPKRGHRCSYVLCALTAIIILTSFSS